MQTLWTRVAQVRVSCRCPQCVSSTQAVTRRAAATATRRAPRFLTTSTVWYSGIFAVAATLDLGVKQQRREQWNQAIADVKQELAQADTSKHDLGQADMMKEDVAEVGATDAEADVTLHHHHHPDAGHSTDGREAAAHRAFLDRLEADTETVAWAEMRENLDTSPLRLHEPEWPANTGQQCKLVNKLPPQSIYQINHVKKKRLMQRMWPRKLERLQLSIDALQLEFFMELHRRGWHGEAAAAVPGWYAEHILRPVEDTKRLLMQKHEDLDILYCINGKYTLDGGEQERVAIEEFDHFHRSAGDVPLCSYRQNNLEQSHRTAHKLNIVLRNLFDMARNQELSLPAVLAKVFHNLSVCSAPPNIDTFNTIIVGLSDLGTRTLVEHCINSLQCAKMRHNEVTLASILNHWTLTGNEDKFDYWIQLMRGEWGGLSLAQPGTELNDSSEGRLSRKQSNQLGRKVIQRTPASPLVFSAIIKGVTKFRGYEAALDVCKTARHEGWGLTTDGLQVLLKDRTRHRDWSAGHAIWQRIQALKAAEQKRFVNGSWNAPKVELPTFALMLQLCTRCNNRTAFQDIMEQAVYAHPDAATDLIRMVRVERSAIQRQISDEESRSALDIDTLLTNPAAWLEKQEFREHTSNLKTMRWQDLVRLDDAGLQAKGVAAQTARSKLLKIFDLVSAGLGFKQGRKTTWIPVDQELKKRAITLWNRDTVWRSIDLCNLSRPESNESAAVDQHQIPRDHGLQRYASIAEDESFSTMNRKGSHAANLGLLPDEVPGGQFQLEA